MRCKGAALLSKNVDAAMVKVLGAVFGGERFCSAAGRSFLILISIYGGQFMYSAFHLRTDMQRL